MLKKIVTIKGRSLRLPGSDIDTDRIIPARFLKCVTFEGLGNHAFEDDRIQLAGKHPFDREENLGCNILLVDENFGCGSSREHAVPAITQRGIQAIIGLSFAAIFRGNAVGNGLACVTVDKDAHASIVDYVSREGYRQLNINLQTKQIEVLPQDDEGTDPVAVWPCDLPDSHRENLMTGTWDDLAICLEAGELIEETAARLPYFKLPVAA